MPMKLSRCKASTSTSLTAILFCLFASLPAAGQIPSLPVQEADNERRQAGATRVSQSPVIDGRLNEGVWEEAVTLNGFTQAEPFQGQPSSEQTEVRILYDDAAIFIGVTLRDADPSQIVTTAN